MKKTIIAVVSILSITSAFADTKNFEGAYVQAGIGYESVSGQSSDGIINITSGAGAGSYKLTTNVNSSSGFSSGLGVGYGFKVAPSVILTLGTDYNPQNRDLSTSTTSPGLIIAPSTTTVSNRYTVFLSPGYEIDSNSLVYGKVGYASAKSSVNDGSGDTAQLNGYVIGAGYKTFIKDNIYAFAEANYVNLNTTTTTGSGINYKGNYSYGTSATQYNALIGVGYRF